MKTSTYWFCTLLLCHSLSYSLNSYAETKPDISTQVQPSYGQQVQDKAVRGVTNLTTGILEFPKNIINVSNAENSNVFYGFAGGGIQGLLNAMGRISTGLVDLVTAPLPTKPITQPNYVWEDFDANTTYDPAFRLNNEPAKK